MTFFRPFLVPLAALSIAAAPAAPVAPSNTAAAAAARVRGHVEFLASDLLEGRGTGSRGHEIAAAYVASQFRALGLQPAGENGSWYQWVPLRRARLVEGKNSITMSTGGAFTPVSEYELGLRPSLTQARREIDAGMVFVGYGLSDQQLGLNDYAGLDVRGKIVVVLAGTQAGLPTEIAAHLGADKVRAAAAHGAVGLLQIGGRQSAPPPNAPAVSLYSKRPSVDWIDTSGKSGDDNGSVRVMLSASKAMGERLFEGAPKSLAAVQAEATKKGVRPRGFALRPRLSIRSESRWEDFKSPEVIAKLPGADPRLAAEHVVLMGHLDHLGIATNAKPGADVINNGALDNAAGVATMLEAAHAFVASGKPPRRSVMFIANTGEELGLLGADYFAAHPTVPAASIVGVVDLDMPLLLYPFTDVIAFGADRSTVAKAVADAGRSMGVSVAPDPMPEQSIFVRSDHYRFVTRGIPAILLMTGYANGGEAQWKNFLGKVYHSPADDLDQKIDWASAARYGELNYRIARVLADADQRPLWYRGDYFGDRFAPTAPRATR
ncbi:MAG: M20/M25/M40 family metallo-hydrolase [Pseudomonadota bacterium]|nr:M20/M25/M40 family metallo-hydrolase [Pseudomonadota bacterium]